MSKIKTRETVKDIKVFDRAANMSARMKNTIAKSKDAAERTPEPEQDTPENYAVDKASGATRDTAEQAAHKFKNPNKKASENIYQAKQNFQDAKRHISDAKNAVKKTAADRPKKEAIKHAPGAAGRSASRTRQAADQSMKTARRTENTVKQSLKNTKTFGKNTTKTAHKTIKTAERTAKTTVKTTQQAAKTAQKTAQISTKAAKTGIRATKIAVKAAIATIKATIALSKALISAIAAGGWVAVIVILVICLVGLLAGSVFGIFFSGEDSGSGYTMPVAIAQINTGYADEIKKIRDGNTHDEVSMSGSRADWKEVLAVYAVKTNTDPDNARDVATMDESKKELLRSVFWDMNTITHRTKRVTYTEITVIDDGNGNMVESKKTVTKKVLYITVAHKTVDEMAIQYRFTKEQKAQLTELLSERYADLWSGVLYGIHKGGSDIVAVAVSQIGNVGGEPYWSWYGFSGRIPWCACFVSWCANECGYIDAGIIPRFAACQSQGISWFKDRGLWQEPGYIPATGDIIFFDWENDGSSDHVGFVEYVEGEVVHAIEGNTSDSCARRSYRLDSNDICGYGTPLYR